ncbi:CCT domain-containing protein [Plasmodiophora brassicae]
MNGVLRTTRPPADAADLFCIGLDTLFIPNDINDTPAFNIVFDDVPGTGDSDVVADRDVDQAVDATLTAGDMPSFPSVPSLECSTHRAGESPLLTAVSSPTMGEQQPDIERWKRKRDRIRMGLSTKHVYDVRVQHAINRPRTGGRFMAAPKKPAEATPSGSGVVPASSGSAPVPPQTSPGGAAKRPRIKVEAVAAAEDPGHGLDQK